MNAPALKLNATPLRQVQDVRGLLMNQGARDQLAAVAAKHMNPERMMRVIANAIRTTPKLGQCEPMSFLGALMQCASLGLEPNTILGHAYMIPFDNRKKGVTEVQVVVGYKGLIDLARRSGHITSLSANIHYSDDEMWLYEEGTEAQLRHRPGPQAGTKLHAYAIAKFKDGGHAYVVLPWAHVLKIRDGSQGYQTAVRFGKKDSPWIAHEDEMAKKTAVRALAKYLPLSVEFMDAMTADEARADYRAFAMDPTQGLQTEDGDMVDGEAEDADHPTGQQLEDQRGSQTIMPRDPQLQPARETGPKPAPVKRQQQPREAMTYADQGEPQQTTAASPAADQQADPEVYQTLVDRIAGDLLDMPASATVADVLEPFSMQIAQMKTQAPGVFENLRNEVASYDRAFAATL